MDEENKIYSAPESKLVDDFFVEEKIVSYLYGYDNVMKSAIVVLIFIGLAFNLLTFFLNADSKVFLLALGSVFLIVHVLFIVLVNKRVRNNRMLLINQDSKGDSVGIWGHIWRYYISKYASIIFLALIFSASGVTKNLDPHSVELTLFFGVLVIPTSLGFSWLFFSNNRKQQFRWLITTFRGY